MTEFKIGDKVECVIDSYIISSYAFSKSEIGIIVGITNETVKIKFKCDTILLTKSVCNEFFKKLDEDTPQNNVDKIFEMLGVKVNERFYLKAVYPDYPQYKYMLFYINERFKICSEIEKLKYDVFIGDILNGKYVIVKQLLTNEEKEFLSNFEIDKLVKYNTHLLINNKNIIDTTKCKHKFTGLTIGVEYTPQELGLCSK